MSSKIPVLVIGAGPVGLAFAAEMARYGVPCRIIDKAQGTKEISKALILHVRTQEVLDAMGITHALQDAGKPMKRVEIIGYGKHIGHGSMEGINSAKPYPIILGQNVTEHILHDHLDSLGVKVEWQTEAVRLSQDDDQVLVTVRHADGSEEQVSAEYVLGADGTHSIAREQSGIEFQGEHYGGQAFIQSDSKIRWSLPKGSSYLWFTDLGYMMVIEMPGDIVRTFISVPDPGPDHRDTTLQEVNDALNRLGKVDAELYDPVWVALFRVNHRAAPRFRSRRVLIAGDAAHEHVPIGGQGMNTSIQDAFNLAWKLAYVIQGNAHPDLLDTYQAERHPVAESLLAGTDEAYTTLLKAGAAARHAIRMFGPFVLSRDMVRHKMRDTLEEVNINYRKGPLTLDFGGSDGPEAGDRALDGEVVLAAEKKSIPLRELLRGTHWTALFFSGKPMSEAAHEEFERIGAMLSAAHPGLACYHVVAGFPVKTARGNMAHLLDVTSQLHDQYGVDSPCLYILRPDHYVGFRSTVKHAEAAVRYLDGILRAGEKAHHA
jgi:2-polyprenyl-6-methoxyphenol hydroxylase-like FAD-dependent oxidoreductase